MLRITAYFECIAHADRLHIHDFHDTDNSTIHRNWFELQMNVMVTTMITCKLKVVNGINVLILTYTVNKASMTAFTAHNIMHHIATQ